VRSAHCRLDTQGEFAKVESFFRSKLLEFTAQMRSLSRRIGKVHLDVPLEGKLTHFYELGSRLSGHPEEAELIKSFLLFAREIDTLRGFVMTNAQALIKICKKHDKLSPIKIREHFMRVLSRCTFYNSPEFGGIIADVKVLSLEIFERFTGQAPCDEDDFTCPVCDHVLRNPLLLTCGHRCCNSCVSLNNWFSQHNCPVCNEECQRTEEHMRVDLLQSHFQRLVSGCVHPAAYQRSLSAEVVPRTSAETPCSASQMMRRISSEPRGLCHEMGGRENGDLCDEPTASMPRISSDSALSSAASVSAPSQCKLESPCGKCSKRNMHVYMLRRKLEAGRAKQPSPHQHSIIDGIIKENVERERRLSSMSGASASSDAKLAQEFVGEGDLSRDGAVDNSSVQQARSGNLPALIIPTYQHSGTGSRLVTLQEELSGWKSPVTGIRRTSSAAVAVAQEMWGKVNQMEDQKKKDRSVRVRLWALEVTTLLITFVFCLRVGYPEVICPELQEGAAPGRMATAWRRTVCGSWGGIVADAKRQDQHVADLQAARIRSLHLALDNMVSRSSKK